MTVEEQIEQLSVERQQLWREGDPTGRAKEIAKRLTDLYEEKRIEATRQRGVAPTAEIVKRARIEAELERLAGR